MSSKGQFDFNFQNPGTQKNMQQVLDNVDKLSIDWDNFDVPHNDEHSKQHSQVSDLFNKSKKSQSEMSQRKDFQDSRDIMEISIILPNANSQNQKGSFRFQKEDQRNYPKNNQRYTRLQQLLETAKKNSIQQFYKNIDRQNKAYNDQPQKFVNYNQFKDYVKQLKLQKRQKQSLVAEKQLANPFGSINSNKLYSLKSNNTENKYTTQPRKQERIQEKPQYNFTKKPTNDSNPFATGSLLPTYYADEHYFQQQQPPHQPKKSPTEKYNNFYQPKPKQKAPQYNDEKDAFGFFETNKKKEGQKKQKQKNLQIIRQQKHNSFQKTTQQKKLQDLFQNYKEMRKNFEDLMYELKSTNQGQQNIVTELRKLKDQRYENQLRQNRKQRQQKKQKEYIEKNKKLDSIKDQIAKIKTSEKDILYSQINKKIQQLEQVVRSALEEINQEKQIKIVPKITNYFCDHQGHPQDIDHQLQKQFNQFNKPPNRIQQQFYDEPSQQRSIRSQPNQQFFPGEKIDIQSRKKMINVPSQQISSKRVPQQKKSRYRNNHQSQSRMRSPQQNLSRSISQKSNSRSNDIQNLYSPLDVQLQTNFDNSNDNLGFRQQFSPEDFAQQFFPREFQINSKNFRNSLIQKSSVIFQSFDFHVSARFSVVDDLIHPIVSAIRIGNKCSIDLYDVHAIIYGPHGPGISTDPSTVFQEQVKKNSSFAFQVSVDKSCLEQNGFSIQISYKTDSMSKKKINFKVPLPLVQLIRPQFIYEQKFINDWNSLTNQLFIRPKSLDSNYLRSHEDLKLILPFIDLNEDDPDSFSYGLMFRYPKSQNIFYLKVKCYVSGKALIQLRLQKQGDKKLKEQILNVLNFIFYGP